MSKIKNKQKTITISLIIMLVLTSAASTWVIVWHVNNKHRFTGEIVISGDKDFRKYQLPGSGTKTDPYIIENLRLFSIKSNGISISETSKCFIIRNCIVRPYYTAIYLSNVNSELVVIQNNTLGGTAGVLCSDSSNIVIRDNYCISTGLGIGIWDSTKFSIINNNCSNQFSGISLSGEFSDSITANNTCSGNYESGIRINYFHEYRYQYFHSYNVTISNNTCTANDVGMYIHSFYEIPTKNSTTFIIDSNNCSFNEVGIGMGGYYVQIINNNCNFNNRYGISCHLLWNSTIANNNMQNNTEYGLRLYSVSGCFIYFNNFFHNNLEGLLTLESQCFDDSNNESRFGSNFWFNVASSKGNFWSELIWSSVITYDIDGGSNSDLFPLQNPIT